MGRKDWAGFHGGTQRRAASTQRLASVSLERQATKAYVTTHDTIPCLLKRGLTARPFLYAHKFNSIFGEPGTGKVMGCADSRL